MTETAAKRIGSRQGLITAALGLLTAQLIMTLLISSDAGVVNGFLWLTRISYKLNIFIGAIILIGCGHFYGQAAGKAILVRKRNHLLAGCSSSMAALLTTAFLAGWTGFIQEGIDNMGTGDNPFEDYIFKPLYWVTMFGFIPAMLAGLWLGWRIRAKGRKLQKQVISAE